MSIDTYRLLPRNTENGKRYILDTNGNGDADESQLVKQSQDGWQPVDQLDKGIDRFTFEQDYGLWQDKEVSHKEGPFWNRRTVVDRPADGKIDADEVKQTTWIRYPGSDAFRLGADIAKDSEGRFSFNRHDINYGRRIIGQSDIDWQAQYRQDDANWAVPKKA
jgi:hypothetical protein